MKDFSFPENKGQVLPLVAIMIFVIIGMAALAVDISYNMYDRRVAQTAADAGALAGARQICQGSDESTIIDTAVSYAQKNKATNASASYSNKTVTVTTSASNGSFFGKIFNKQTLTSTADASAGCYAPSQAVKPKSVLPVAWYCKSPVDPDDKPATDCVIHMLSWANQLEPITEGKQPTDPIIDYTNDSTITVTTPIDFTKSIIPRYLYVVTDSASVSFDVSEGCANGQLSCIGGGFGTSERGWLNLNGGADNANELSSWISGGFDGTISIHKWYPGTNGTKSSVYHSVQTNKVYLVPVFNGLCDQYPTDEPDCISKVHKDDPTAVDTYQDGNGNPNYYHIIGFSAFYVTCVKKQGNSGSCPGQTIAVMNSKNGLKGNEASIEGYFLYDYPSDLQTSGTGGDNVGISVISLTE